MFIGRTDAYAEAPILWSPDVGQEKRAAKDEVVGWHHRLNGQELEQILGNTGGQRSLECYSPWGSQRVGHNLVTEQQQQSTERGKNNLCPQNKERNKRTGTWNLKGMRRKKGIKVNKC